MKGKFTTILCLFLVLIFSTLLGCNTHKHTYTYYTITEATCSTDGEKEGICSSCGQKIYVPIPASHQYAWQIISEPTCTQKGSTIGVCVFCGNIETIEIPMTEHIYENDICTVCGQDIEYTYLPEGSDVGWTLEDIRDELNSYGFNHTSNTLLGWAASSTFDLTLNNRGELNLITKINYNESSYSLCLGKRSKNINTSKPNNNTLAFIEFGKYTPYSNNTIDCNVIYTDGTRESFGYLCSTSDNTQIHAFALNTSGELLVTYKDLHVVSLGKIKTDNNVQYNDLIYLKNGNSYSVQSVFDKNVQSIVIPPTHRGLPVTTISPRAFKNCTNLTEITLSDSINTIWLSAFNDCTKLKKVYSPKEQIQIQFLGQMSPNNIFSEALWIIE